MRMISIGGFAERWVPSGSHSLLVTSGDDDGELDLVFPDLVLSSLIVLCNVQQALREAGDVRSDAGLGLDPREWHQVARCGRLEAD